MNINNVSYLNNINVTKNEKISLDKNLSNQDTNETTKIKKDHLELKSNNGSSVKHINIFPENKTDSINVVKTYDGKNSIFPADWKSLKVRASASIPNQSDVEISKNEIKNALGKYPKSFLVDQKVKNIHLLGTLSCFGTTYTGTNSRDSLYIGLTNNKDIEKTLHHELSSVLLRNNPANLDKYKWNSLSKGINSSSSTAIKEGLYSVDLNPQLFQKGFLTDYSMSNPENDFNMFAENVFSGGKQFWDIVDKSPKIAEKAKMVIEFYEKINPIFNENYFRALTE